MQQYKELAEKILAEGFYSPNRTGVGTTGIFGYQMRFDLRKGFPLLTLKETRFKPIVKELLWFLRGETNIKTLGSKIWNEWADETGECGPIYGSQWRHWKGYNDGIVDTVGKGAGMRDLTRGVHGTSPGFDQIKFIIEQIKTAVKSGKNDRRIIVSAWNVEEIPMMALAPCHVLFQFSLRPMTHIERQEHAPNECKKRILDFPESDPNDILNDYEVPAYYLSCQLYQRSADLGLGVPFNIASYALLTSMVAQVTNTVPLEFVHTFGDVHIYENHIDGIKETISREEYSLPTVTLNPAIKDIDDFTESDIKLENYTAHPFVPLEVAI